MRRQPLHTTTKLPKSLLAVVSPEESGVGGSSSRSQRHAGAGGGRKERRRAGREQKKTQRSQPRRAAEYHEPTQESNGLPREESKTLSRPLRRHRSEPVEVKADKPKSILKRSNVTEVQSPADGTQKPRASVAAASNSLKRKLTDEDAKIAALEQKLGLKGKKNLPKAFKDDGLDSLLDGLGDGTDTEDDERDEEEQEWLRKKRRKVVGLRQDSSGPESSSAEEGQPDISGEDSGSSGLFGSDAEDESVFSGAEDEIVGFQSADDSAPAPRVRENPYVAPLTSTSSASTAKYVPPSRRAPSTSEMEILSRLRRQLQGLLNRLSEANFVSVVGEIEQLYQGNARQHVTSNLIDLLVGLISDEARLLDSFVILHAGFMTAIYKIVGSDFGAAVIARIVEDFDAVYSVQHHSVGEVPSGPEGKASVNLMALLSELYKFQLIGSRLMFDYVQLFLSKLSEYNTELLLRIILTCGTQLRQDDPSALKDIASVLQIAANEVGEGQLSTRTRFMIETIQNLKNNRARTGAAASAALSESTLRMKKILGSLTNRPLRANEPLRIGLRDVRDGEKKGKWWLVGASWRDDVGQSTPSGPHNEADTIVSTNDDTDPTGDGMGHLLELAKEQRMNTDVRRAIFLAIMSASDHQDARLRLTKLRLTRTQELEVPRVLAHCSGAEQVYNPYYTLIARRLCAEHRLNKAFQFNLWDLFKRLEAENDGETAAADDFMGDDDASLSMRKLVNLAKMYGALVASGSLPLHILKPINLPYIASQTRTFVEILFITLFLALPARDDRAIAALFTAKSLGAAENPQLAGGVGYFLKTVVAKTDIAGSRKETERVKWACRVARDLVGQAVTGLAGKG
ncbi:MAG: suppressor of glycerol defect [Piccolia ochrophora]|nr:MAG: suppressor of glycerol defect [Piccolia ochrophora]